MISIITGLVAGVGIEALGLIGGGSLAAAGSPKLLQLLRLAPTILKLAKAVRELHPDHHQIAADAEVVIAELESK